MYNILIGIIILVTISVGYNNYENIVLSEKAEEFVTQQFKEDNLTNNNSIENNVNNELYYKGYEVVGRIEVPSINIDYPIIISR